MKKYECQVFLTFTIEDDQSPLDAVSEMLTNNLVHSGALDNWNYTETVICQDEKRTDFLTNTPVDITS